jgi:hypothetical protein
VTFSTTSSPFTQPRPFGYPVPTSESAVKAKEKGPFVFHNYISPNSLSARRARRVLATTRRRTRLLLLCLRLLPRHRSPGGLSGGQTTPFTFCLCLLLLLDDRDDLLDLLQCQILGGSIPKPIINRRPREVREEEDHERTLTFPCPSMMAISIFFAPVCTTSSKLLTASLMVSSVDAFALQFFSRNSLTVLEERPIAFAWGGR